MDSDEVIPDGMALLFVILQRDVKTILERAVFTKEWLRMATGLPERILDAAIRLLERDGVRAFRQTKVAKEAGIDQGHLTYYFPRRSDLLGGVLARFVARGVEEGTRLLSLIQRDPGEARARLLEFARAMVRDRRRTRLLLGLAMEVQGLPAASRVIAEQFQRQARGLAAIFGRAEDDPEVALALAALRGLALEHLLTPGEDRTLDALVDRLAGRLGAAP
jgi:DNA-binding transcriptional regulator YbjK